jgi:hypothetical protein
MMSITIIVTIIIVISMIIILFILSSCRYQVVSFLGLLSHVITAIVLAIKGQPANGKGNSTVPISPEVAVSPQYPTPKVFSISYPA